jgi:hypothetical protein
MKMTPLNPRAPSTPWYALADDRSVHGGDEKICDDAVEAVQPTSSAASATRSCRQTPESPASAPVALAPPDIMEMNSRDERAPRRDGSGTELSWCHVGTSGIACRAPNIRP